MKPMKGLMAIVATKKPLVEPQKKDKEVYYRISVRAEDGYYYVRHAGLKFDAACSMLFDIRAQSKQAIMKRCDQ